MSTLYVLNPTISWLANTRKQTKENGPWIYLNASEDNIEVQRDHEYCDAQIFFFYQQIKIYKRN